MTVAAALPARIAPPLLVASLAILVLTVMDALMKALTARHPVVDIALARFLAGALFTLPVAFATGMRWPGPRALGAHALRAVFVLGTSILFITALKLLPLSEAVTITFIAPSLVAIFARIILGEPVSRLTLASIVVCFAGVVVIARDDIAHWRNPGEDALGIAAALGAAFTYAMSLVLLRARAQADGMVTTVTIQHLLLTAFLLPINFAVTGAPLSGLIAGLGPDLWRAALIGLMGATGHFLLAYAYSHTVAARIGALEYTGLIWAVILGYVWFNEWPAPSVLAGAALIVAGSSLLLVRGRR
ncbi:MAG: DMT family transporter [Rhizobiales bacterium]|nr:DMT family transporter [Hyphomicrobiales bacterium]